jgi:transposase-like protein
MGKQTKRSYDEALKLIAVELYRSDKAAGTIAKDLGIGVHMLRRWAMEHEEAGNFSFLGKGRQDLTPSQKEIRELKKALQQSEMETGISKSAVSIFQGRQQIFRFIKDN